jgi:aerobic-type carbon monoxide dehydrogenase small subunit (CoxS/CutS family)
MPKDKKISFSGKNPTSIVIEKGENIFVSDGLSRSCVIRGMEADGHEIFTIEEVVVNRGAAPTIKTEIVQRN